MNKLWNQNLELQIQKFPILDIQTVAATVIHKEGTKRVIVYRVVFNWCLLALVLSLDIAEVTLVEVAVIVEQLTRMKGT